MATAFRPIPDCLPRDREDTPSLGPGELPDGFHAVSLAGHGTFSEIWQVRDCRSQTLYALKRLRAEWRDDATARRLLANEARAASAVNSRHVVRIIRSQAESERCCLLFEWLDGITLEQRLAREGALPVGTAVWIARQCAQGLADLAQAGYAHGDVKPSNIILTQGGDAKLVDLGFARSIVGRREGASTRLFTGTAEYMAPEALLPQASSPITKDVYSLGISLFRMVTGCLPFVGDTTTVTLRLQRTARPPQLRRKCPSAPRELAVLVDRMLAKQPIRRPASLTELVRSLINVELTFFPQRLAG
ncbi:MAG: serine/threonine-protein kinase [Planctomycetaceae bacterium]